MRWILILLIGVICTNLSVAQGQIGQGKEIDFLAEKFELSDSQVRETTKIIRRKNQTLKDIQKYKDRNPEKYTNKLAALYEGTLSSVQMILETKEQKETFRLFGIHLRKQKSLKMARYKKDGLTPEEASNKYYREDFFP